MIHKKIVFSLMSCLSFCCHPQAQSVIKGFEFGEIINIAEAYHRAPSLSFNLQFNYTDSTRQDSILEQIPASYKMQGNMYWAMIDSTEIVQGNSYNVSIFHYDSIIAIANPQQSANVMQLPVLDSLFRTENIDSMNVTQVNDSTRKLQMYFNRLSKYSNYLINYDQNSYLMHSITYFIKTPAYDDGSGSGISMIKIIFSNYSYDIIGNNFFQEDKFIYKQGDKFFAQPSYSNFQLMVHTSN